MINLIIPLAIIRAIRNVAKTRGIDKNALNDVRLKWPNDIL